MKKNGFVFVETIVAIVVLTSSLLLLYATFNKVLQSEKTRVYYDDVTYIYRTYYIKNKINELNMEPILNDLNNLIDVSAGKIIILLISIVPIILIPTTITTAVSIAIKFV